jgi:hypothetical protein
VPNKEIAAKLAKYKVRDKKDILDPAELPGWVKTAIALSVFESMSYEKAAARFGRAGQTLQQWMVAPASKKWREELRELSNDPTATGRAIVGGSVGRAAATLIWCLEQAEEAGDYKEARQAANDVLRGFNVNTQQSDEIAKPTIIINVPVGSATPEAVVAPEFIEVESEAVEDADVPVALPGVPEPDGHDSEDE